MGSRSSTHTQRGRSWRPSAGAASFGVGPREGHDIGALGPIRRPPPGFDPLNPREAAPRSGQREPWALKTTDTLRPGERGTKGLTDEFGDRLVCVRYRCDPQNHKRYKTVEVIVAESDWDPPPGPDDLVHVRVAFGEEELRRRVKEAGGKWRPASKTWELPLGAVKELGLTDRIVAV